MARAVRVALLIAVVCVAFARCSNVAGNVPSMSDAGGCTPSAPTAGAGDDGGALCPGDTDGLTGGCYTFDLTVDDRAFSPFILKAQNLGLVSITLKNTGTKPHSFFVDCLPTPNASGCPAQSCFPATSTIPPVAPRGSASTTFATPNPEGIYNFHSRVAGDSLLESDGGMTGLWGQFVVQ